MDELYHYGVKGMRWGIRKKTDPYRQDLGGGVQAVWPSKKAFKKAEKARYKRDKAEINADVKEYRRLRSDVSRSIIRSVDKKTTEQDLGANTMKMLRVKDFVEKTRAQKGKYYVDDIINRANKKDRAKSAAAIGGFTVTLAAVAVGTAYLDAKFG